MPGGCFAVQFEGMPFGFAVRQNPDRATRHVHGGNVTGAICQDSGLWRPAGGGAPTAARARCRRLAGSSMTIPERPTGHQTIRSSTRRSAIARSTWMGAKQLGPLDSLLPRNDTGLLPGQLGAAYFIPTFVVPLLLITHGVWAPSSDSMLGDTPDLNWRRTTGALCVDDYVQAKLRGAAAEGEPRYNAIIVLPACYCSPCRGCCYLGVVAASQVQIAVTQPTIPSFDRAHLNPPASKKPSHGLRAPISLPAVVRPSST